MLATLVLMTTDLVVLLLCYGVASAFFANTSMGDFWGFFSSFLPCVGICIAGFVVRGLYPGMCLAPAEELKRYTQVMLAVTALWLGFKLGFLRGSARHASVLTVTAVLGIPLLVGCRVGARALASRAKWWGIPVVVFGAGKEGRSLVDRLLRCRWIGYKPEIILDDGSHRSSAYRGVPIVPRMSFGEVLAKEHGYSTALIAMRNGKHPKSNDLLLRHTKSFPTYIVLTDHSKYLRLYTSIRDFEGALGLSTTKKLLLHYNVVLDRIIDLVGVVLGAVIFLPVVLTIAVLIALDSPGPVFYCHRRLGKDGREFRLWKFRTMVADAEDRLSACLDRDPELSAEWDANHKLKDDPRITRIGRFLRQTSLDELPQLWNVLKGDMSLIGPRPIIRDEVKHYGAKWNTVSSVLPGMTGLWQVSGRSDTGYRDRVELDNYYIQNWSVWLDLHILLKTAWIVLRGRGAY